MKRLPEVVHGLSALVENAADFAASSVRVGATVDEDWIVVEVLDDGPGFAPDILPRLGEPYVTSRPHGKARRALAAQLRAAARPARVGLGAAPFALGRGRRKDTAPSPPPFPPLPSTEAVIPSQGGMGLGFFIARTLLERTGGRVSVGAGDGPIGHRGARVTVRWPRASLETAAA